MIPLKRAVISIATLAVIITISSETIQAACNATVNGRPMTPKECALSIQVYGQVIPGNYFADNKGNWVNVNNPMHRGNTFRDSRKTSSSWGGHSYVSPRGVYDSSGGCEGGSCVNIID